MKELRIFISAMLLGLLLSFPAYAAEGPFINLGPQVQYVNVIQGKAGLDQYGHPFYYALLQGEPAKLAVVDLETKKIADIKNLEGATGAWSIEISPDHKIWIGSTPNNHLYRYDPAERELSDLGRATGTSDTTIWDLAYDTKENQIFGVTSYGGNVFSYSDANGFKNLGAAAPGRKYARSVAFDPEKNILYAGAGSPASLIKWDLNTGEKTEILPEEFRDSSSVYNLDVEGGKIYAKLENKSSLLVINKENDQLEHVLPADSRGISAGWGNGKVFYSSNGKLFEYDSSDGSSNEVKSSLKEAAAVSLDIVNINGESSLVGLAGNGGNFYTYNLERQTFSLSSLKLPSQSVEIYSVGTGANGEIYSSGFISGKLGVYNPETGKSAMYRGLGQVEGMVPLGDKMYFGVYPNGLVYEYDPSKEWMAGNNPRRILNLSGSGQDRPVALVPHNGKSRLYIGTFPKRGGKYGTFSVYDVKKEALIHEAPLSGNQSVSSMELSSDSKTIYMGTSVYDGGGNLSKDSAKIYEIETESGSYNKKEIKLPGGYAMRVSALLSGPDGKLWGIVDNKLMVYDPKKGRPMLYPITSNALIGLYKREKLLFDKSGELYGTFQGMLFKVNPATMAITCYRTSDVFNLTADKEGNLYYNRGSNLWAIKPNELTAEHILIPGQLTIPNVASSESPFPVAQIYAKQPLILYRKEGDSMIPVEQLDAQKYYKVYGTYKNYYHYGSNYYFYNEPHKLSRHIGRVFSLSEVQILKPDGTFFRFMKPGEKVRVFNYNDQEFDVGNGYKVLKTAGVTYSVGTLKLTQDTVLFQYGEALPFGKIDAGEQFEIVRADGNKLDLGNGFYIEYNKARMTYMKN